MAAPAKATRGNDFDPTSSSCRNNSRNSNGGVTAARTTRQKNIPRSPNHSRNLVITPLVGLRVGDGSTVPTHGSGGSMPVAALAVDSLMGLTPDWALRADCLGASGK